MAPGIPSVVQNLCSIPPEIVHTVLNDLPLGKILQLTSYDIKYIDDCILSHLVLREYFNNEKTFVEVKEYYRLYAEVCRYFREKICPDGSKLAVHVTAKSSVDQIKRFFHTYIHQRVEKAYPHLKLLRLFSDEPNKLKVVWNSSRITMLRSRWDAVRQAETRFNNLKSAEMAAVADLYAAHPDLLKRSMDPAQFQRENTGHVTSLFRWGSKKLANSRLLWKPSPPRYTFRFDTLPIVPYDKYLDDFVAGLEARDVHPAKGKSQEDIPKPGNLSGFPPEIAKAIEIVTDGMAHVYVHDDPSGAKRTVIRTRGTAYSAQAFRKVDKADGKAHFVSPEHSNQPDSVPLWRLLPHHEKELEWLRAFITVLRYFQQS